jgi:hypothetical protein
MRTVEKTQGTNRRVAIPSATIAPHAKCLAPRHGAQPACAPRRNATTARRCSPGANSLFAIDDDGSRKWAGTCDM